MEAFSKQLKRWQVYNPHDQDFELVTQHPDSFAHDPTWAVIRVPSKAFVDIPHATYRTRCLDGSWADDVRFVVNSGRGRGCTSGEEFDFNEKSRKQSFASSDSIRRGVK